MPTKKPLTKTNLNLKIFFASIFLIFILSFLIFSNVFASCGDGTIDSGEECDFNAAFGPYPNQCPNNGACDQATCKCSSGGTTGTIPTPTPTGTASFSADKVSGTTPLIVNFTLTNGAGCINYMCDTGVGVDNSKYVYEKSFSCTYTKAGTYTASISCNGNVLKKTITVTGTGTGTTPTPTANPTPDPNSPNIKPTDYVTLHDAYPRAPEDNKVYDSNTGIWTGEYSQYYAFSQNATTSQGLIEKFRAFIPPGTVMVNLVIKENGKQITVSRHKFPPIAEPTDTPTSEAMIGDYSTLAELIDHDCWSIENQMYSLNIADDGFAPVLGTDKAGWLYTKVGGGGYSQLYNTYFGVRVDIKTYNAWWDKYIKDEAGWNEYIENVETYIDPTIETKTPTCKADFSKTEITAPGESKLSFSSENTTKLIGSCTGLLPIKELELPLSYTNYPFPFLTNQTGTATCTFTPYNGTIKGTDCSATVTVKNSTASTPKPKPADVVSITKFYPRAPTTEEIKDKEGVGTGEWRDRKYYAFGYAPEYSFGYIPYFRGFIPPGTVKLDLLIIEDGKQMAVARHKIPPTGLPQFPPTGYTPYSMYTLSELEVKDLWTTETEQGSLYITHSSFYPLDVSSAGWLYVKVDGGSYSPSYSTQFTVKVDTKTYNAWWDKYIKDEAGWNKYIENVETYVDPTTEIQTSPTPTPTQTPSLTATISSLDANFTITNGTSCVNYMCDTTTKTMVASEKDFEYQKSFVCHYTKAGNYTASIECPNNNIITKIVTVKNPAQSLKACKRDNPDCEKLTCNNVYCNDGCERKKGTRVCDGKEKEL